MKEVEDKFQNGNFTVMPRLQFPKDATVVSAIWQKKEKQHKNKKMKKLMARLNIDACMKIPKRFEIDGKT